MILKALIRFLKGLLGMGPGVMLWLGVLMAVNAIMPFFFWPQLEAILAVSTFFLGFILLLVITHTSGFTRLLGLGHVLWIPLVLFLLFKFDFAQIGEPFYGWMAALIICNSISLAIDIADVYRYVNGDKKEMVEGL